MVSQSKSTDGAGPVAKGWDAYLRTVQLWTLCHAASFLCLIIDHFKARLVRCWMSQLLPKLQVQKQSLKVKASGLYSFCIIFSYTFRSRHIFDEIVYLDLFSTDSLKVLLQAPDHVEK